MNRIISLICRGSASASAKQANLRKNLLSVCIRKRLAGSNGNDSLIRHTVMVMYHLRPIETAAGSPFFFIQLR